MKTSQGNKHLSQKKPRLTLSLLITTTLLAALTLTALLLAGCSQGKYVGKSFSQTIPSIVIFEIEGPGGEEFTKLLATQLSKTVKVEYGPHFREPNDLNAAAKITRDYRCNAFIKGQITKSEMLRRSEYAIHGIFTLHNAKTGDPIGGIANASRIEDVDPIANIAGTAIAGIFDMLESLGGNKTTPNETKHREEMKEIVNVRAREVRRKLAEHVAKEFAKPLRASWLKIKIHI